MHVGHHRGYPAHVVVLATRAFLAGLHFGDVALHRRFPEALVRHVDGEFLGVGRNLHVFLGQDELALFAIQSEHDDAVADGQDEQGGRAVHRVAGGDLGGAGVLRSAPSGHLSTEKMVPMETLTSMFEEPSSGSKVSRYSPFGKRCGTRCGRSISSEAMAARWPPHSLASSRMSLDSTSSFFCASPCTLSLPASPSTPPSPPLPMSTEMVWQARETISIRNLRSPVMAPLVRCSSVR